MRNHTRLVLLLALLPLVVSACSSKKDQVKSTVEGYVAAELAGTDAAQKPFLVKEDRKVLENNKQATLMNEEMANTARKKLESYVTVDLESVETKNGKGTVEASVEAPTQKAVGDYLGPKVLKVAEKHKGEDESKVKTAMQEKIGSALEGHDFATQTSTRAFELRKEDGEWRVYRNLERRVKISDMLNDADGASIQSNFEEAYSKLESARKELESVDFADVDAKANQVETNILTRHAKSLRNDGNYDKAIAKLEKASGYDVDGGRTGVSTGHVQKTLEETKNYVAYQDKLEVKDVQTETGYSKKVSGTVQNGDRDLSFLEVRITFKDDSGETIHEETEPVTSGDDTMSKDVAAGASGSFEMTPYKDWTDNWSGEVDVQVSDFRFADSKNSG